MAVALAVLMASVIALQVVREHAPPLLSGDEELLYVRSPEAVKRMALSYDSLLADVYWIRAIQHYGDTRRSASREKEYALLYPLLDLTTSLDPRFNAAYLFGAIFLAEAPPGGPGQPEQAIALLKKGVAAQPHNWRLIQALGFIYYWWYEDYRTAARWFEQAAAQPGAPLWMASLAAVTLNQGGDRDASRQMWLQIAGDEADEWFRTEAVRRLQQLDALDQLDELSRALAAFEGRYHRQATDWADLVRAGMLRGVPLDPAGVPYRVQDGHPALDPSSRLLPLPDPARLR